ncbi:MAG TPA: hypothetical protein VHF06_30270 [Pseudonocardiaceae bacterium]|nr:hypothetical protein [Pseudonocardiaceae bacterium]
MGTAGPFGPAFWLRLAVAGVWVAVPLVFGVVLAWWTTRRRGARARVARLVGLAVGAVFGVLLTFAAQLWLAPIAVVAGYLVAAFTTEVHESPVPTGSVRTASLRSRTLRDYVPLWAMVVAVAAAVITVLTPVVLSAVPTASYGPWHPIPEVTLPGEQLHWPRATEWVPLGVVAAGALVVGVLLVQRVLRLPADRSDPDESGRRVAVRTITGTVVGIELLALGALIVFTSSGLAVPAAIGGAAYTASRVVIWTGLVIALTGIVLWWVLSARSRRPSAPDVVART